MLTPDKLFSRLTLFKKLIGYAEAYEEIVGPRPKAWNQYIHEPEVTKKSRESTSRLVQGLRIQLDALIVDKKTRRPGKGHFSGKQYTESQWISAFGDWPFEEIA